MIWPIFRRHQGKPNDPKSMFNKQSLLWIQSKLSMQIQLLRGWEEGDSETWCSQLPKGMYTPMYICGETLLWFWPYFLFCAYSTHCPRRLSRHSKSQHSTSGTGSIMRFVGIAAQELNHLISLSYKSANTPLPLWLQMLSCLEYMYHDLGLVKEFNMNPITLKRWLVNSKP